LSEVLVVPWPHGRLTLRPERSDDLIFRFQLFCDSRTPEWYQVELPPEQFSQVMHQQFQAQTESYARQLPDARFDIIELDGVPIGRIVIDRNDKIHLSDQAIVPALRNQGLGTAIMRWLIAESVETGRPISLYVASSNDPSMRLYLRMGFETEEETPMYLKMSRPPVPYEAA
jgi:ribosomal protein S18 acetylase RimI-like enzyme